MSKTVNSPHQKIANNQRFIRYLGVPDSNYLLVRSRFDDFDEFATAIRAWDLDFRQLDRGQSITELSQFIGPQVLFSHSRFTRHYHQLGSTPPGMRTFGLLEENVASINWFGREVTSSSLLCFPTNRELEAVTSPDFACYTISFSEELLSKTAATLGLPDLNRIMSKEDKLANCDPAVIQLVRSQLRIIRNYAQQNSLVVNNPEVKQILEAELPGLILTALSNSQNVGQAKPVQWKKQQALKKASEYLNEFPNEPISVNALCQYADVSVRTLESAFKEYYGVTPKNYLKATRLNGVYKELREHKPKFTSITDIANKWGFWHMGQFAADYKRQFGVLPSATLRQRQ